MYSWEQLYLFFVRKPIFSLIFPTQPTGPQVKVWLLRVQRKSHHVIILTHPEKKEVQDAAADNQEKNNKLVHIKPKSAIPLLGEHVAISWCRIFMGFSWLFFMHWQSRSALFSLIFLNGERRLPKEIYDANLQLYSWGKTNFVQVASLSESLAGEHWTSLYAHHEWKPQLAVICLAEQWTGCCKMDCSTPIFWYVLLISSVSVCRSEGCQKVRPIGGRNQVPLAQLCYAFAPLRSLEIRVAKGSPTCVSLIVCLCLLVAIMSCSFGCNDHFSMSQCQRCPN